MELPKVKQSIMDNVEPRRIAPYTESEDPNRANILKLQLLPKLVASKTERNEPNLAIPYTDIDDP
jgi:hypothetical protein